MISTFDNCLYIHIPKTAGQSIESVFLERAGLSWEQREAMLLKPNSTPELGPPRLAHLTTQEYLDYGYLTKDELSKLFKFTIVRNPWDRLVSEYRYKQHKFAFKDFLFNHFPEEGVDDYKEHNGIYRHVMPQYQFIYDNNDNLMVDFVGKFENLKEDFASITQTLCGQPLDLPHKNKTQDGSLAHVLKKKLFPKKSKKSQPSPSYKEFYDDESKEFIGELYKKDIALFDYTF
ncbi:sulfotransferase family protein [Thalassotalea sp. M1531]|uniref:Sulfotransferase family protein n=1 Tax=Thalassotalea algicola TaxID=2716224 RepID=A0A7Y0LEA8_9GAMM|nr:sulfotransferase family protein [Thalassotalea algicola]NMP32955.1 sulfotransferase family protein [Thalassotalea algicola]